MNTLATLSLEQLDQLYDWLLEMPVHKVREKLARPAPYGFGVETYITTLQRFKQRRYAELAADQLEAAKIAIAASAQSNNPNNCNNAHDNGEDAILDHAIATTLKRQLFARASTPDATNADLGLLARYVQRNDKIKIDIERVQISRERLAQNNRRLELLERTTVVREKTLVLRREESEHRRTHSKLNTCAQSAQAPTRTGLNSPLAEQSDHLGPYAVDLEGIRERARKHFGITPEESARRAALRKAWFSQKPNNSFQDPTADFSQGEGCFSGNPTTEATPDLSPGGTTDNSPATSVPGTLGQSTQSQRDG